MPDIVPVRTKSVERSRGGPHKSLQERRPNSSERPRVGLIEWKASSFYLRCKRFPVQAEDDLSVQCDVPAAGGESMCGVRAPACNGEHPRIKAGGGRNHPGRDRRWHE